MDLKKLKINSIEIAAKLGITEAALRYRLKRFKYLKHDGRNDKSSILETYYGIIDNWIEDYQDSRNRPTIKVLL